MGLKYRALYEQLCEGIDNGKYAPGQKLPTEAELSSWGFSRNTVRQALALLEEEGRILKRRGSSSMVKPLRNDGEKSGNVAVIVQDFSNTIFPQLIEGISDGLYGWGTPLLYSASAKIEEEARILSELPSKNIEGVLVNGLFTSLPNPNLPAYRRLIEDGIPVVFVLSYYANLENGIHIINDDVEGGAMAVRHLYEQGRRKPCGVFTSDFILGTERYEGYINECQRLGLEVLSKNTLWVHSRDYQSLNLWGDKIIKMASSCDSMVCGNDFHARAISDLLIKSGVRIPEDIAIVSFDNTFLCDFPPVSLTSLDGNAYEVGRQAAGKLKNILAGKRETSVKLPWTLIKRESS